MFFRFTVSENEKIWSRFHSTWEWPQTRRPADVHQTRHPSTCRWTMQWRCFKDLTWMAMELWVLMNCESRLQAKKCRESDNHVTCIVYIFFVENRSAVLLHCAGCVPFPFNIDSGAICNDGNWHFRVLVTWQLTGSARLLLIIGVPATDVPRLFGVIDTNSDGSFGMLHRVPMSLNEFDFRRCIGTCNPGNVDFEEFIRWMYAQPVDAKAGSELHRSRVSTDCTAHLRGKNVGEHSCC